MCVDDTDAGDTAAVASPARTEGRRADTRTISAVGNRPPSRKTSALALSIRRCPKVHSRYRASRHGARRNLAVDFAAQERAGANHRLHRLAHQGKWKSWLLARSPLAPPGFHDRSLRRGHRLLVRNSEVSSPSHSQGRPQRGLASHFRKTGHASDRHGRTRLRFWPLSFRNLGDHRGGMARPQDPHGTEALVFRNNKKGPSHTRAPF